MASLWMMNTTMDATIPDHKNKIRGPKHAVFLTEHFPQEKEVPSQGVIEVILIVHQLLHTPLVVLQLHFEKIYRRRSDFLLYFPPAPCLPFLSYIRYSRKNGKDHRNQQLTKMITLGWNRYGLESNFGKRAESTMEMIKALTDIRVLAFRSAIALRSR